MPTREKKIAVFAGILVLSLIGVGLWLCFPYIRFYYLFEPLGRNKQGYPEYRHRQTGIVMVRVPGGTFAMGSPGNEPHRSDEELQHEVTLSPFLLAKYEVSQAQWAEAMGENPSHFEGEKLPVEYVSWFDCKDFCEKTGLSLPSEAQWEYACRGKTHTAFSFGPRISARQVNFDETTQGERPGLRRGKTVPVTSFEPNGFGLFNMHGNVSEWCEDGYDEDFYATPGGKKTNPLNPFPFSLNELDFPYETTSPEVIVRGGSYYSFYDSWCRSACRSAESPKTLSPEHGLRPAFYPLP